MGDKHGRTRLEITEEIINTAKPKDSAHCMIADAVKAAVPDATRIAVDLQTIRWTRGNKRYVCFTPAVGQRGLIDFDQGRDVRPFWMYVKPVQILPAGARHNYEPRTISTETRITSDGTEEVNAQPVVHGGRALPLAALSNHRGRRREFGLRMTER